MFWGFAGVSITLVACAEVASSDPYIEKVVKDTCATYACTHPWAVAHANAQGIYKEAIGSRSQFGT